MSPSLASFWIIGLALDLVFCPVGRQSRPLPQPLLDAELIRMQFSTASVEWSHTQPKNEDTRFFASKFAGDDHSYTCRGTATGQRLPGPDRSGVAYAFSEDRSLFVGGEQWCYTEESVQAEIREGGDYRPFMDVRLLGFVDTDAASDAPGEYLPDGISRYEVEEIDDTVQVSAFFGEESAIRRLWVLSPAAGMQPIQCSTFAYGEELTRSETRYQQVDNRWFPKESEYFFRGSLTSRIDVLEVSFDQRWHDQELSPDDIGIVPGIHILQAEHPVLLWDGERRVTIQEYAERLSRKAIDNSAMLDLDRRWKEGTAPRRYSNRGDESDGFGLGPAVKLTPSLWETYVRRFIAFYRLDKEQTGKAWKHHGECQTAYFDFAKEREDELKELQSRIADLEKKTDRSEAEAAKLAETRKRLEAIEGYKAKVFDERLKPGLLKLPTESQVTAAKERAAAIQSKISSENKPAVPANP